MPAGSLAQLGSPPSSAPLERACPRGAVPATLTANEAATGPAQGAGPHLTVAVARQPSGRSGGARRGRAAWRAQFGGPGWSSWRRQCDAAGVPGLWHRGLFLRYQLCSTFHPPTTPSPRETRAPGQWLCGAGGWGWAGPHRRVASLRGRGGGGGPSRQQLTASPRYVLLLPRGVFKEGLLPDKVRCGEFDGSPGPRGSGGTRGTLPCTPTLHALSWSAADPCAFPHEQPCSLGRLQKEIALWDSPRGRRLSAVASTVQPGWWLLLGHSAPG